MLVVAVLLALSFLTSCEPAIPGGMAVPVQSAPTSYFNVTVTSFTSDTGAYYFRLVDIDNNIICYGRMGDSISCVKTK